jgi:hypothetical protein
MTLDITQENTVEVEQPQLEEKPCPTLRIEQLEERAAPTLGYGLGG